VVTTYLEDAFSDPLKAASPDSGLTVKTFDAAGNVITQTDNKGQLTSLSYDALNRVAQITRADQSTVTFSYDQGTNGIGHLTGMIDTSGSTNWSYDQHGRVAQKTSVVGSTTLSTLYGPERTECVIIAVEQRHPLVLALGVVRLGVRLLLQMEFTRQHGNARTFTAIRM
jgi:YD repeat-containing protein